MFREQDEKGDQQTSVFGLQSIEFLSFSALVSGTVGTWGTHWLGDGVSSVTMGKLQRKS